MSDRKKTHEEEQKRRFALTILFSGVVFCFMLLTMLITGLLLSLLLHAGFSGFGLQTALTDSLIIALMLASLVVGSVITAFMSRFPLGPVNKLINAMNRLSSGDFRTRLRFSGPFAAHQTAKELSDSFNRMASELENTQLLRTDFVNNFSHEFKTPIVSIAGFASLLRRGDLTEAQEQEYLAAIEEESQRLSRMATNVLDLSRVENLTILSDTARYNLSEQLRGCILLLEPKWTRRHLELDVELPELFITASEELLKQVWINLLDNAVKFAPEYGLVRIEAESRDGHLLITVTNSGPQIPPERLDRIFQKFYQADESHAGEGNGIGLAIVKRVVELHGGEVYVESGRETTSFTVLLPEKPTTPR